MDFTCPGCHAIYHATPEHGGAYIRCSKCGQIVQVPATGESQIVAADARTIVTPDARRPQHAAQPVNAARRWGIVAVASVIAVALSVVAYRSYHTPPAQRDALVPSSAYPASPASSIGQGTAPVVWDDDKPREGAPTPAGIDSVPEQPRATPNPAAYRRLPNAARIADDVGVEGLGKLTVENGTPLDAVVRLVRADTLETVRWFYVQSKKAATKGGIEPGEYELLYTSGEDWDEEAIGFQRFADYDVFERRFVYWQTVDEENATKYKTVRVTLHTVPFGNVRTRTC